MEKIEAQWSIGLDGFRRAKVNGMDLVTTNRRTQGGWGPVAWAVILSGRIVRRGEVWQSVRYSSLVREAMFEAEKAAREVAFDLLVG